MRTNMLLSAATLMCLWLSSDAGHPDLPSVREFKAIPLPAELVAQLKKRTESMVGAAVTLHPGHIGNSSDGEISPRRHSYDAQARAAVPCGRKTTVAPGDTVQFQSVNYPSFYPPNHSCVWKFKAQDPESKLNVQCSRFIVKPSARCTKDKLFLIEILSNSLVSSIRYCGEHSPLTYTSISNKLTVSFRTDRNKAASGFSCTVTVDGAPTAPEDQTTTPAPTTQDSQTPPSSNCNCGNVNRVSRIVGGQETEVNEYPWQVGVVDSGFSLFCGGSIISENWVLTAAHCVVGADVKYVLVGDHDWTSGSEAPDQDLYEVAQVIRHSNYNSRTVDNDIAVLRLTRSLDFSKRGVGPVCLPSNPAELYVGASATVSGWGATSEGGNLSPQLQEVDVPVLSNADCSSSYPTLTSNMLCAGLDQGGKDSCQGDSGGPMVHADGGHYDQIGVVSWGRGCARPSFPGVYARVTEYLDWIASNTGGSGLTCSA